MGIKQKLLIVSALVLSSSANAALVERLGGLAYYDDVADLTWLADANAGTGSAFDDGFSATDGFFTWAAANNWAASIEVAGVSGWRMPDSDGCVGLNCTGSEMGNMFYNVLGGIASNQLAVVHNSNYDLFTNIALTRSWSSTEGRQEFFAFYFDNFAGHQIDISEGSQYQAWAVQSGDVSAVPVPAAVWLFGSGLIGLIGVARRKVRV